MFQQLAGLGNSNPQDGQLKLWGSDKWPTFFVGNLGLFHPEISGVMGPYLKLVFGPTLYGKGTLSIREKSEN